MDVPGIGTGDDGTGEAANDATGVNEGEASNGVSSQASNGDEQGRDGAGAVEGGNNNADKDGGEATMLIPPTMCLGGDCQRHCDNCCRIQFDHDNTSPYYFNMYEIRSHNIKGIRSPFKQVKSHTRAPSAETRVSRGDRCILNLCHNATISFLCVIPC